ncbi:MAG: hypothetical protein P8Y80_17600 [Acidobacteriota bacterium]
MAAEAEKEKSTASGAQFFIQNLTIFSPIDQEIAVEVNVEFTKK